MKNNLVRIIAVILALQWIAPVSKAKESDGKKELEGKLASTGSDTLGSLSSVWAELLQEQHPRVQVEVRAIGSAAAPTALIQGTAEIGPMSRPMSPGEQEAFRRRYGYAPTPVVVGQDALAVFVHRDNPITTIAVPKLDALFSSTRFCGQGTAISHWGQLGLLANWAERPISLYGRTSASGTYSVFRQQVLCGGDFSPRLNRLVGSSAIVRAVAMDRGAIGYASAGYVNANVRALTVVGPTGREIPPLSRELYLYLNRAPGATLSPLISAYMSIALSSMGQREVVRSGYSSLSETERQRTLAALGIPDG